LSTENKIPKPSLFNDAFDEKLFRLLIARIEDYAIFMLDPNGYILSWNQGAESTKGYASEEIIGKHLSVFYTWEDQQRNEPRHQLNEALKNNMHEIEGWRVRKDGTRFWANVVFTTLYDDEGHLVGFSEISRDVTARKKDADKKVLINAELERLVHENTKKVIAHERRFRKLIEHSHDGISLFDRNLQVFYRSRSAERINGWSNVERVELDAETLVHPDDLHLIKNAFAQVLANPGLTHVCCYRSLHKQGHYIWLESLYTNLLDDQDIGAIVCNFRDVTERAKAEEQIKEKNRQIENILESITDGFIALDKNYRYTYANSKIGEMLGCTPDSLIGKNVWELFPEAVGSTTDQAFKEAMEQQRYTWNEDYYAPLGLWQENHIYPSADGLSVFIRDITERKLAEASLLQSESNLRSVFENTDQAITLFDTQMNIISFNQNAFTLAKLYFKKELKPGNHAFYYASDDRKPYLEKIVGELKTKSPITYEISYPLTPEITNWYETRWVNVLNNQQETIGIILAMNDITRKKQQDMERDRITADLLQRNKDLEQFTYIVSHNLRAPVANIQGLSYIMLNTDSDEENAKALNALDISVQRLDHVIFDLNNILEVNGAANDTLEFVSLPQLVDEIGLGLASLIRKNRAKLTYDFGSLTQIRSLKGYLHSIFQNLIINSIKYRRAEADPVIKITGAITDNKAIFYVQDNGRGIDLKKHGAQVFGLYKRFDLNVEGKGMGLFMVKMQMERLGGAVSVQSTPNHGTAFKLEFPLDQTV